MCSLFNARRICFKHSALNSNCDVVVKVIGVKTAEVHGPIIRATINFLISFRSGYRMILHPTAERAPSIHTLICVQTLTSRFIIRYFWHAIANVIWMGICIYLYLKRLCFAGYWSRSCVNLLKLLLKCLFNCETKPNEQSVSSGQLSRSQTICPIYTYSACVHVQYIVQECHGAAKGPWAVSVNNYVFSPNIQLRFFD